MPGVREASTRDIREYGDRRRVFPAGAEVIDGRIDRSRADENDILEAARRLRGLENMSQIKYAVFEKDGSITIIPFSGKEGKNARR